MLAVFLQKAVLGLVLVWGEESADISDYSSLRESSFSFCPSTLTFSLPLGHSTSTFTLVDRPGGNEIMLMLKIIHLCSVSLPQNWDFKDFLGLLLIFPSWTLSRVEYFFLSRFFSGIDTELSKVPLLQRL